MLFQLFHLCCYFHHVTRLWGLVNLYFLCSVANTVLKVFYSFLFKEMREEMKLVSCDVGHE